MRRCGNCDASLEGRRSNVKFCDAFCRKEAFRARRVKELTGTDGNGLSGLWLRVGSHIREPLPDDWPKRSATFWRGVAAIERSTRA